MNPQVLGTEHLIYVAISLLVAFATCFFAKKYAKTEKQKDMVRKQREKGKPQEKNSDLAE